MPGAIATSSVVEFYNDGSIFVTGATGFLGKAIIEKLLRVCPNIHIYMLVRVKKGKDPQTRFKELFEDPLFERLRSEKPDFEKKITCIPGDISCLRLGMSDSDYEFLTKEVTHVIHSAATVRFNEHIKSAVGINVLGTREIVRLCNKCIRLKVLVHVSTAFSNCIVSPVGEKFYEPPMSAEKAISLTDLLSEDKLTTLTDELIKPWPNTYTFTKVIAESIIKDEGRSIPSLVVRPAIVMGSYREPVEGWIDNIYGPTGIIAGVGVGLMRVFFANKECNANIVPVDLTVNCILCSAWEVGSSFNNNGILENSLSDSNASEGLSKQTETVPKVYNFVGDESCLLKWGEFVEKSYVIGLDLPSIKTMWYYTITLTNNKLYYWFLVIFLHYIPGFLLDSVLRLLGKKPQLLNAYRKVHSFTGAISAFSNRSWRFTHPNTRKLWSHMSDKDKELFHFDMQKMDWDSYLKVAIIGIRKFILKDPSDTLPVARRRLIFFWLGHRIMQFSLIAIFFWVLSKFFFTSDVLQRNFTDPVLMHTGNST